MTGQPARRFILCLTAFLLPYVAIAAVGGFVVGRTGELLPVRVVAALQAYGTPFIFETKFSDHSFRLKVEGARWQRPEVLAIGTSRAAGWRAAMFRPLSFYNAGRAVYTERDHLRLLDGLGDYSPRVIVMGFDFFTFHPSWDPIFVNRSHDDFAWGSAEQATSANALIKELRADPYLLFRSRRERLHGMPALGLRAAETGTGARIDGSLLYGGWIRRLPGQEPATLADTMKRVAGGFAPFPIGDQLDEERLHEFQRFVETARKRGISLIAVAMPYAVPVVNALDASPRHKNWKQFQDPTLAAWLRTQGVIFFNFSYLDAFGGKPDEFVDPFHPSEPANIRMLLKMLENPDVRALLPGLDPALLKRALASSTLLEAFPGEL